MYVQTKSTNRDRLKVYLLLPVLLFFLSARAETLYAAGYSAGTSGSGMGGMGCDNKPRSGNPYAGDGLQATASDSCNWSSCGPDFCYSGTADAGAFGSDTSLSNALLEALDQVCVEPMAFSQASANCAGACTGYVKCSHSAASMTVTHRVGDNPINPIPPATPNLNQILNNIHVQIKYRIDASHDCAFGGVQSSFSVSGCNHNFVTGFNSPVQVDTVWEGTVYRGCVLNISANAATDACSNTGSECQATVSVDPLLQIDPAWEYAQYFIAEQESLLVPGEWKEVTRDWKYFCECDLEPDGDVDGSNLYAFMQDFGRTDCSEGCPGDLNGDGKVDEDDLVLFAGDFGKVNCK